jgi:predicted RNase H-related nuclease YkuK (DUF458 family)
MSKTKARKDLGEAEVAVEETEIVEEAVEETKIEVKADNGRDAAFYKRHPGAIDGVIYE